MARVVRFQAIHVDAVAMNRLANIVASAMEEILAVAGFLNHAARRAIHLPALQRLAGLHALLNQIHSGIAGFAHYSENLRVFLRHLRAQIADPGDVVIDAPRRLLLAPNIEQQQVAFLDRGGGFARGTVVRILAF